MMKKTQMNLKQFAYETIKDKIIRCEYKPNDILSEAIIMEAVDASRTANSGSSEHAGTGRTDPDYS